MKLQALPGDQEAGVEEMIAIELDQLSWIEPVLRAHQKKTISDIAPYLHMHVHNSRTVQATAQFWESVNME